MSHNIPTLPITVKKLPTTDLPIRRSSGLTNSLRTLSHQESNTRSHSKERRRKSESSDGLKLSNTVEEEEKEEKAMSYMKKLRKFKKGGTSTDEEEEDSISNDKLYEMISVIKSDVNTINETITKFYTVLESHQRSLLQEEEETETESDSYDEHIMKYYLCGCTLL